MITPTIETERLILKRGTFNDYIKVYEYDFTRLRNISGEFVYVKFEPDNLVGWDTYADEEENCIDFIIYLKDEMIPIGNLTYDRYKKENKSLEIAYNLHPNYWKKGYMTEAVLATMSYIFDNLDIENIRCGYADENINSKLLNERIGFQKVGYHMEHYNRINKDIKEIDTIMSREDFKLMYDRNKKK